MGPQHDSCGRGDHAPSTPELVLNLQWGRNMIVAEGMHIAKRPAVIESPSMGPQHDSCGRSEWYIKRDN